MACGRRGCGRVWLGVVCAGTLRSPFALARTHHVTTHIRFSPHKYTIPISIGFISGTFTFSQRLAGRFFAPHNSSARTLPRTRFYLAGRLKDQSGDKAAFIAERTKEDKSPEAVKAAEAAWIAFHNAQYLEKQRAKEKKAKEALALAAAGGGGGGGGGGSVGKGGLQ